MNERIKELLTQSGLQPYYDAQQGQIEKFAELIVRECVKVNYNSPFKDGEFHARELLEHFGVE